MIFTYTHIHTHIDYIGSSNQGPTVGEDTHRVLQQVLAQRVTTPLDNYCKRIAEQAYQPAVSLVKSYLSLTTAQRNTLGRWLQQLHKRACTRRAMDLSTPSRLSRLGGCTLFTPGEGPT